MGQAGSSLVVSVEMREKEIEARCGLERHIKNVKQPESLHLKDAVVA